MIRKLGLWLLIPGVVSVLGYLLWLPDVARLQKSNPQGTSLMRLRQAQAREKKQRLRTQWAWVPLDRISPHLVHAVILAEDDTFYTHKGFDLQQIKRAVEINWKRKRWAYGGSTMTQQLARTLYLSPNKSLFRKAKEALITIQLERRLTKTRILEIYLNVVEWGKGIYGAEAASRAYFDKGADALTTDEAIALASILPSPRRWSPASEKAFMARRRTQLHERMIRAGYVPPDVPEPDIQAFDLDSLFIGEPTAIPATPETDTAIPSTLQDNLQSSEDRTKIDE